jgi:predicted short-subunit dehydrogenase-like oxidoreductase (DUF2520 family)
LLKKNIAVIGAGKLAWSLTNALVKSGYNVQTIISRKKNSAKLLANKFSIPHYSNSLKEIPRDVNSFFLTVPDGEIKKVAEKLSKLKRDFTKCICVHFSGVENISALESLEKKGCIAGSIHIIRPFPSKNIVYIKNSPASIEAEDKQVKVILIQLCRKLKLKPHLINSDEKVFNHLAAVHSSNFLVGNLFNAFSLIDSKGDHSKAILKKTTQSALDNIFKSSPAEALSGPIDRGDIYTIKKHINELDRKIKLSKDHRIKLLRKSYIVQSLLLLDIVKSKYGKLDQNHKQLKGFLQKLLP